MSKTAVAEREVSFGETARSGSQWIEDLPISEMKLYFDNFRQIYSEFQVLSELTTKILASMGIILRPLNAGPGRNGVHTSRFNEFDEEDEEQEMDDEGIYSSTNVLSMHVGDDSTILPSPRVKPGSNPAEISPSPDTKENILNA